MWQQNGYNKKMLHLGSAIPLHVGSFLKLGLQPELSERREMDLQEIYLMLRLQAAAISHTQQKETHNQRSNSPPVSTPARMTSSTPIPHVFSHTQIQPQHEWDAVKEKLKRVNSPPPPPPLPPPPQAAVKEQVQEVSVETLDCDEEDDEGTTETAT